LKKALPGSCELLTISNLKFGVKTAMATIRERSTKNGKPHFHVIVRVKGYSVQKQTFSNKTKVKQNAC